jgi:hypothetical protein
MKIRPVGAESFHADGRTDMKLIVACRSFANAPKMEEQRSLIVARPKPKMILRDFIIFLYELNLIPVFSYYWFISTVFHTVCPSDVQSIYSESTEFSSNKPDGLEEVTTGVQKSELVGVSSWDTSWSISNSHTYNSSRATKQGL